MNTGLGKRSVERLDPQCVAVVRRVAGWGAPAQPSVSQWRELERRRFKEFGAVPEHVAEIRDTVVVAPGGPVPVRIYRPIENPLGTFVWLHGGGWALGSPDLCDDQARTLTNVSNCVVVSVDYRLAPEHPFPDGLQDSLAVLRWASAGGADQVRRPLIVGGDSAGGNLAAAVTLLARDAGEPAIAMQVLVYPALNRDADTASKRQFAEGFGLTTSAMRTFWDSYAGTTTHQLVSPLRATALENLPPALVLTAECDVLRDEGEQYAERLSTAGGPVTLRRYEGMMHGFLAHAGVIDMARDAFEFIGATIRTKIKPG